MGLGHIKEVLKPASLDEVISLLHERGPSAGLLGGGVSLVRYAPSHITSLIDLSTLPLNYVRVEAGCVWFGATTTLREMLDHPLITGYLNGIVAEMLRQVASPLLRNLATIGGALVSADPWSDVITLFLALGAHVAVYDGTADTLSLGKLYPIRSRLGGAILTDLVLPAPLQNAAAAFCKFNRTGFDIAVLNCACQVQLHDDRCVAASVVIGGTPRLAASLLGAQEVLTGQSLTNETIEQAAVAARDAAEVREDLRASAEYRKQLVYVGVRRCLQEINDRFGGGDR